METFSKQYRDYQPIEGQQTPVWQQQHFQNGRFAAYAQHHDTSTTYQSPASQSLPWQGKTMANDSLPLIAVHSNTPRSSSREYEEASQRFRFDCAALTLCVFVWLLIAASVVGLISLTKAKANSAGWIDGQTVAGSFVFLLGFSAISATVNEALIDRVWRRIRTHALRGEISGDRLRAANFQLADALKRLFTGEISRRELGILISTFLLRWGGAAAFSCLQLTVQIERNSDNPALFLTHIRLMWVPVPLVLHIFSIFAGLAFSGLPPWSLFFNRWDEEMVLTAYRRYLEIVPYGSAATSEQVAVLLDRTALQPKDFSSLAVDHRPGFQAGQKIKGTFWGTLMIIIIPSLLYLYQRYADEDDIPVTRFIYSLGITTFATGYTLSQNFVIWTLGLEGITGTPRSDTNGLGTTSGIMLLVKAVRQRRPIKVFFLYCIFWLHAIAVRFVLFAYLWLLSVQKTVPEQVSQSLDDLRWAMRMFWPVALWMFILPPFAIWFIVPFNAPLAALDGWRIAKILEGATLGKGMYGVEGPEGRGRARWGMNTRPFKREILL